MFTIVNFFMQRRRNRERSNHFAGFGAGAATPVDGPAALGFIGDLEWSGRMFFLER